MKRHAEVYCQTAQPPMRAACCRWRRPRRAWSQNATVLKQPRRDAERDVQDARRRHLRTAVSAHGGQVIVEAQPGKGVDRLLVRCPARYVVVPDFGDDMVFGLRICRAPVVTAGRELLSRPVGSGL